MSNEIERITIEVDSSKAVSELDRVEKKMDTALSGESAAKKASKTGKEITNTFSKAADKITKEFKDASTKAANSLDDLVDVADDIKDAFDDLDIEKTIGNGASKAADKIENEVGNALAVVKRELGEVNTTLTKMNTEGMVNSLKKVSAEFDVISKTLTSSLNSSMAGIMPILSNTINSVGPALTNALSGVSTGLDGSKVNILPVIDIPKSDFRVKDLPEIELEPSVKMDDVLELDSTVKAIPDKLDIDVNADPESIQRIRKEIEDIPRKLNLNIETGNTTSSIDSSIDRVKALQEEFAELNAVKNNMNYFKINDISENFKINDLGDFKSKVELIGRAFHDLSSDTKFAREMIEELEKSLELRPVKVDTQDLVLLQSEIVSLQSYLGNIRTFNLGIDNEHLFDPLIEDIDMVQIKLQDIVRELLAAVSNFNSSDIEPFSDNFQGEIDDLSNTVGQFKIRLEELVSSFNFNDIDTTFLDLFESKVKDIDEIDIMIDEDLSKELGQQLSESIREAAAEVSKEKITLSSISIDTGSLDDYTKRMMSTFSEISDIASQEFNDLDNTLGQIFEVKGNNLNDIQKLSQLLDSLERQIESSGNAFKDSFSKIHTIDGLKDKVREVIEDIKGMTKELVGDHISLDKVLELYDPVKHGKMDSIDFDANTSDVTDSFELIHEEWRKLTSTLDAEGKDSLRSLIISLKDAETQLEMMSSFSLPELQYTDLLNSARQLSDEFNNMKDIKLFREMRDFSNLDLDNVKSDIKDTSSGIERFREIFSSIDENEPDFDSLSQAASYFTEITKKGNSTLSFLEGIKAKLQEFNSTETLGNLGVSIGNGQDAGFISTFTADVTDKLLDLAVDMDDISTEAGRELRENLFAIDSGAMGTEALSSIIDSLENDLNKAIREVGSKHNVVQELLSGSANQPVTLPPVDLNFEQVLREIPGQFANLGSSINEVIRPAINAISDGFKPIAGKIANHLGQVTDVVKRSLVSVGSAFNSTFPKIVPAVKSTFNVAKNSVMTFGTVAKQVAISAVNAFANKFPGLTNSIVSTFSVAKRSVMTFSSTIVPTFNKLRQSINYAFAAIKTSPLLAKLNGIRKAVSNLIPNFSKLRAAIKKSLTDAGFNFDAARAKIDAFKANVSTIGEGFTKMKGFITGALSKVKDLVSGIRLGKSATDSMNKSTLALRNTFGSLTSLLAPYLSIFYVIRGIGKAITMGNEATETESLYKTVFEAAGAYEELNGEVKEIYPEMNAWIKEQNELLGLNTTSLRNNTAQVYKFAETMGIANKDAAEMSRKIALLAEDMASFYNKDSGEIFDNLMSGLAGMTRAVSKYGMNIYETNIKQNAARFGINAIGRELTQGEKMWVRYKLIIEQAGVASGDLARTLKSPANQIRLLKSDFITLGTIVGQAMQPILVVVIPALRTLTSILTTAATKVKDFLTVLAGLLGINMDFGITGGLEAPDAAADLMDETANVGDGGAGDLASGYDDAADSIGGAADAAKELNKELGSMDEINTLDFGRDKGGSGSGSGGSPGGSGGGGGLGGSGGGGDFSANYKVESDTSENEDGPFSKAAVMFAEMFKQFQIGFNRYMPDLREAFEGFTESFGRCCESLSSFLSSVYRNGGKEFIQRMGEVTAATAIAALEIGGTILDSLAKLWDHLDPERNKATYLFILHMNNLAITVKNALLDIGDAFSDLMNNGGQDVLNQLGTTAMSCGSMMAQFAETVLESMRKVWEYINPANNPATQEFLSSITALLGQVQALFDNITNNLNGFSSSEGMTTIQRLAEVFVQIATAVTNTIGIIIGEIAKLWAHLDPETNPYVSALASAFEDLLGRLTVLDSIMAGFLENGGSAFLQNMMDIGAIIGTIVVEAITWLLDNLHNIAPILQTISEVVKTIIEFIQENAGIIATVLGSFALLAGIGTVIGKVTPIISAAIKALKLFKGAWDLVTMAIDVVQIALGGLSAPVAVAIALIALVVAAVIDLWDESEAFRDAWKKVWDNIKTTLKTIWDSFIKPIIDSLVRTLLDIWNNGLKPLWEKFKYVVEQIGIFMADILNAVLPIVNKLVEWFGPVLAAVFDKLCTKFGDVVVFICNIAGDILTGIGDVIAGVKKIFNGIITFITGVFTGNWKKAWQGVKDVFAGVFKTLGGVLKAPINMAISAVNACIRGLNRINIKVPDWVPGIGGQNFGFNIAQIPKLAKGKRQSAFVKSRKNGGTLIQIISEAEFNNMLQG